MRSLLRLRNARIYLIGDVVSSLGDYSLWLAMAIWVKEMTGSSAWAGLVMFCFALGNLFSPLGGVVADRFRRRPLLITLNLMATALVLLLLLVHGRSMIWLVFTVMFGYGLVGSAMGPAQTALLPAIVPAELLAEANAAQQTLVQGLRLVTPLIGAGLFVWLGAGPVAVIDAATFCVAVGCLAALRVTEPGPNHAPDAAEAAGEAGTPAPAEVSADGSSAGFRYLAAEPVLRAITMTLALVLLTLGFTESAGFSVVTRDCTAAPRSSACSARSRGPARSPAASSPRRCSSEPPSPGSSWPALPCSPSPWCCSRCRTCSPTWPRCWSSVRSVRGSWWPR